MHLTVHADYSLRVLIYLAGHDGSRSTIRDIAGFFDISHNHLMKVVQRQVQQGLVIATRGKGGGLALARPASKITVAEVVSAAEPDFDLVECFGKGGKRCAIHRACRLKGVLSEAQHAFMEVLNSYTLADLALEAGTFRLREWRTTRGRERATANAG